MNIEFPILNSGLIAQLPINLRISKAIIHNLFRDGGVVTNSASSLTKYAWDWTYNHLNPDEMNKIVEFWEQTDRGAKPIRFYDPIGNLFRHSEELASSAWQRAGQIEVVEIEPIEGHRQYLLTNSGDLPAELHQIVNIQSAAALVLSLKARWEGTTSVVLMSEAVNAIASRSFIVDGYQQCELAIPGGFQAAARKISFQVPGHTQVVVSEAQLEIGVKRGDYLMSIEGGIFDEAWMDPSSFRLWSTAPGCHSINMNVVSFR